MKIILDVIDVICGKRFDWTLMMIIIILIVKKKYESTQDFYYENFARFY